MKNKFIKGPLDRYGNSKIVNIDQVSNIAFEIKEQKGSTRYKIIYNMSYPISLKSNNSKMIPDYVYMVFDNEDQYQEKVDELNLLLEDWIAPIRNDIIDRIVNPKFISFINTDINQNRVIVNLATSISFYSDYSRHTSDFIYFTFDTPDEFESEYKYMRDQLGLK